MFKELLRALRRWRICYRYLKEVGRGVSQQAYAMLRVADGGGCRDLPLLHGTLQPIRVAFNLICAAWRG